MSQHPPLVTKKEATEFKATTLSISTFTVITNLNSKINLGFLSRFINVYEQTAPELDLKAGGAYNLEYYGNCARGETLIDKIKDEFNNQATLKFKYWGFRNVNIKVFANGTLQMTGLKYEDEAKEVGALLIEIIKNIKISITSNIDSLVNSAKTCDFQLIYDPISKNVFYYRKYYERFLSVYNFDTDLVYDFVNNNSTQKSTVPVSNAPPFSINYNRKGFIKGVHDVYLDTLVTDKKNITFTNEAIDIKGARGAEAIAIDIKVVQGLKPLALDWSGDNYIKKIIEKIERIKDYFTAEFETVLTNANTLKEVKINIELLKKKYSDFSFSLLDKLLSDIGKNLFENTEQKLRDIKCEIFQYNRLYKNMLNKKINRLITIRTIDINICSYIKEYLNMNLHLQSNNESLNTESQVVKDSLEFSASISLLDLEFKLNKATEISNYFVNKTQTVLINSNLLINHNINLKKMSKILRRDGLYNSFDPDDYHGVLTKYYYNTNNKIQGICNCTPHCSTKEKHSICTKITISVFSSGSVIITGARDTNQLMSAHNLILKILKDNIDIIKAVDNDEDKKQIALLNNEFRKMSRKPRIFYIKKTNILDYEKSTIDI